MIIITADIHLNDLPRDQYRHDWMANILPALLKKHKAELLLILGDLSDDKDHLSSWLVNQTVDHLVALAKICPVIILKGNHDYIVTACFEFLEQIEGLTWINTPTVLPQLGQSLFLPHTHNYKRDWAELDFKNYDWFYTHQTFAGAAVGPRKLDGIDPNIFPHNADVISGDIHQPQSFGPITYVGSPYLEDFGDLFNPRILGIEGNLIKSIPSPGPQKRLVEFAYPNRKIERPWTDYFKCTANAGDILKVRVTIDASQAPQWNQIKDEVKRWGDKNEYVIYLIQPVVEGKGASGSVKARKANTQTDEQLLDIYAKSRAVGEATVKTGKTLMGKV